MPPLQKQNVDVPLGTQGLNRKVDPTMLPPGFLSQAQNVQFQTDGVLTAASGELSPGGGAPSSTSIGNVFLPGATALGLAKENTYVAIGRYGATRDYLTMLTSANIGSYAGGTTLQPTLSQRINIPQYPANNGTSHPGTTLYFNSCVLNASLAPTGMPTPANKVLMVWDVTGPIGGYGATTTKNSYYAIWDFVTQAWFVPPTQLGNFQGYYQQPMALPSGHIVALAGTYTFGLGVGNPYSPTLFSLGSTGNVSSSTTFSVSTTVTTPDYYAVTQAWAVDATANNKVYFSYGLPAASANVTLWTLVKNATAATSLKTAFGAVPFTTGVNATLSVYSSYLLYADTKQSGNIYVINSVTGATNFTTAVSGLSTAYSVVSCANPFNNTGGLDSFYLAANQAAGSTGSIVGKVNYTTGAYTSLNTLLQGGDNTIVFASQIFILDYRSPYSGSLGAVPVAWVRIGTPAASSYVLMVLSENGRVDIAAGQVLGRLAYLSADNYSWGVIGIPQSVAGFAYGTDIAGGYPSGNQWPTLYFGFLTQGTQPQAQSGTGGGITYTQVLQFIGCTYGPTSIAEVPNGTLTSGLAPQYLTANTCAELGFGWMPSIASITTTSGTGGALTGNYSYAVVYEWTDSYGQVHRSAPTFVSYTYTSQAAFLKSYGPVPVRLLGLNNAPIVPTARVTLYRTTAGGTSYYSLGNMTYTELDAAWEFFDNTPDATLLASSPVQLYTQATGELPNHPAPPATIVTSTASYAALVSAEIPYRLYISKPFRQDHPVEWNTGMYVDVSPTTGPITAVAAMDDKLIVFKQSSVFVMYGSSYDITGSNASPSFTTPTQLATFFGALSQNSVITVDEGTYYQSSRGIELITRQLVQEYIGLPLDGAVGTITSTTAVQLYGQLRFIDSGSNNQWVYDSVLKRWSTLTSNAVYNANGGCFISCAAGQLPLLISNSGGNAGVSWRVVESTTASPKSLSVTTGWIKTHGLQGFARLYRIMLLGNFPSSGGVTITAYYNYNTAQSDTVTWSPGTQWTQVKLRTSLQKIESVQFVISTSGFTNAPTITGLSLEIGALAGTFRVGKAQEAL